MSPPALPLQEISTTAANAAQSPSIAAASSFVSGSSTTPSMQYRKLHARFFGVVEWSEAERLSNAAKLLGRSGLESTAKSLTAQSSHRVNFRRPATGNVGRQHGYEQDHHQRHNIDLRVVRIHAVEHG